MAEANIKAVITAEDRASATVAGFGKNVEKAGEDVNRFQNNLATIGKIGLVALATGLGIAAKQAFEQVRSVENASFALKAYEKDATKVNKVLSDLVAFARSDMGVLFQREDLFAAAQTLKLYGQSTETLTDKVKLLARGVSLGKTTFEELSSIVGRAAAKGRLDAVDFDMLIERGIGLDKSFRGATVTSEQLFAALEQALPASLLEGRADTIDGAFVKLQSAFRDLGSTILGVDKETSKFIEGGLGDKFMESIDKLTESLKNPEVKQGLQNIASGIGKVVDFMAQHPDIVIGAGAVAVGIIGIATASNILKDAAVGAQAAISLIAAHPIAAAALAVVATVAWGNAEINRLRDESKKANDESKAFFESTRQSILSSTTTTAEQKAKLVEGVNKAEQASQKAHMDEMRKLEYMGFRGMYEDILKWNEDRFNAEVAFNKKLFSAIIWPFTASLGHIGNFFNTIGAWTSNTVNGIVNWFSTLPGRIAGAISSIGGVVRGIVGGISLGGKQLRDLVPGFATGVQNFGGGLAIVGERGPELVNLPRGSDVIPNNQISNSSNTTININVGMMTGSATEQREAAMRIFENLQDIANTKGRTVAQMIGA